MAILGSHGTVEYIKEVSWATFPTNPAMQWIGQVQKARIRSTHINEDVRALKIATATNRLQIVTNVKTGNNGVIELEYVPQDWTFFKYAMALDAGSTLTDTLSSLSFGVKSIDSTPKYMKVEGAVIDEISVDIAEDKLIKVTAKLPFADIPLSTNDPWSVTDYIGAGSHATASGGASRSFTDVSVLTLGGSAFYATDIKFSIKNNLMAIKDPADANLTNIIAFVAQKRDISFSCKARRIDTNDFAVKHFGYGANNIVLTVGGTTFTFSNAKIPEEDLNFMAEGVSEMEINFTNISDLAIT